MEDTTVPSFDSSLLLPNAVRRQVISGDLPLVNPVVADLEYSLTMTLQNDRKRTGICWPGRDTKVRGLQWLVIVGFISFHEQEDMPVLIYINYCHANTRTYHHVGANWDSQVPAGTTSLRQGPKCWALFPPTYLATVNSVIICKQGKGKR